ncbi:MAG: DUF5667 domain-containing protein [Omnitrophica WOR_2 bacterium]
MGRRPEKIEIALQSCLDIIQKEHVPVESALALYPDLADELRPSLEAALWLTSQQAVFNPPPGFLAASKKRLVAEIKAQPVQQVSLLQQILALLNQKRVVASALILVLIIFFITGNTVAQAAQAAIPGDVVYPLKLSVEKVQVTLAGSKERATQLQVGFVERRLGEMESLILEGRYDYIPQAASRFQEDSEVTVQSINQLKAKDPQKAKQLSQQLELLLSNHTMTLNVLIQMVPPTTQASISEAIQVSNEEAYELRQNYPGSSIVPVQNTATSTASALPSATGYSTATPTNIFDIFPTFTVTGSSTLTITVTQTGTILPPGVTVTGTAVPTGTPTPGETSIPGQPPVRDTTPTSISGAPPLRRTPTATPTPTEREKIKTKTPPGKTHTPGAGSGSQPDATKTPKPSF